MGVPTSEVGYTPAMPRRDGHEVHKDMWGHWGEKNISNYSSVARTGISASNTRPENELRLVAPHFPACPVAQETSRHDLLPAHQRCGK